MVDNLDLGGVGGHVVDGREVFDERGSQDSKPGHRPTLGSGDGARQASALVLVVIDEGGEVDHFPRRPRPLRSSIFAIADVFMSSQ